MCVNGVNISSFLYFCFYKNLRELNGVRTEMNDEEDNFLRRVSIFYLF